MVSASTQYKWFIDKVSKQPYRVVWMNDRAVLLENNDKVQILTSIEILETYYKPVEI